MLIVIPRASPAMPATKFGHPCRRACIARSSGAGGAHDRSNRRQLWTPDVPGADSLVRVDVQLADGLAEVDVDRWVRSACALCRDSRPHADALTTTCSG